MNNSLSAAAAPPDTAGAAQTVLRGGEPARCFRKAGECPLVDGIVVDGIVPAARLAGCRQVLAGGRLQH